MKTFIDPTIILISAKADDTVIDQLDPQAKGDEAMSEHRDQFRLPFLLDLRPSSEFYYDSARSKLMSLNIAEDDGPSFSLSVPGEYPFGHNETGAQGQQCQLLRLAGWVDIESRVTVSELAEDTMHY